MAWNPSPEVAVARDAAAKLAPLIKTPVRQIVILYVTEDDRIGYASYGKDRTHCAEARIIADKMYDTAMKHFFE